MRDKTHFSRNEYDNKQNNPLSGTALFPAYVGVVTRPFNLSNGANYDSGLAIEFTALFITLAMPPTLLALIPALATFDLIPS